MHLRFTLPGDLFPNIDKITGVQCPTYVVHGTRDEIVPIWHGQELHRLSPAPYHPYWVEGGQHNDLEVIAHTLFFQRLQDFLAYLDATPPSEELEKQLAEI
jgi:fermentation-respiration switch protein FrsA (DUF1100 family)